MTPVTTRTVAMRWTRTVFLLSFSRPNLGQIRVKMIPMKKMAIGSVESEVAEARATDGAAVRAARYVKSLTSETEQLEMSGRRIFLRLSFMTV